MTSWQEGSTAKALLVRPRKNRRGEEIEDFWLHVFDDRAHHFDVAGQLGVPQKRVAATLLIRADGSFLGEGAEEHAEIVVRLDPRLTMLPARRSDRWTFG